MLCPRPLPGSPVKDRESLAAAASSPSPRLAGAPVTDQVWRFPSVAAGPRGERPLCKRKQVASLARTASRLLRLGEGKGFQNRGPGRRVSGAASRDCEVRDASPGAGEAAGGCGSSAPPAPRPTPHAPLPTPRSPPLPARRRRPGLSGRRARAQAPLVWGSGTLRPFPCWEPALQPLEWGRLTVPTRNRGAGRQRLRRSSRTGVGITRRAPAWSPPLLLPGAVSAEEQRREGG
ncbi:uncharacterized protein LOC106996975 [Macaca mulatta]